MNNVRIKLSSIRETPFEQKWNEELLAKLSADSLDIQFRTASIIDLGSNQIIVQIGTLYNIDNTELLKLDIKLIYDVENLREIVNIDNDKKQIAFTVDIIPSCLNVAIGALRGVLSTKVAKTKLKDYPIPLMDIKVVESHNSIILKHE